MSVCVFLQHSIISIQNLSITIFNAVQDALLSAVCAALIYEIHFACSSWHIFILRIMGSFLCATLMYANLCFSKSTLKKSRQIDNISSSLKPCVFSVARLPHGSEQSFHQWCAEGPYPCALLWAAPCIHQVSETTWDLAFLWMKGSLNHSFLPWLSPLLWMQSKSWNGNVTHRGWVMPGLVARAHSAAGSK